MEEQEYLGGRKKFSFSLAFRVFAALVALTIWAPPARAFDVVLNTSPSLEQLVGDPISLEAEATKFGSAVLRFQFSVRATGGDWRIVRDFDEGEEPLGGTAVSSIEWATLEEGTYELRVIAVDPNTDEQQEATSSITMNTRITDGKPVVNETSNPLVAIYSVPPCTSSGTVRVRFRPQPGKENNQPQSGEQPGKTGKTGIRGNWTVTPMKTCEAGKSVNFYVAGMRANSPYVMRHEGDFDGHKVAGRFLRFKTGNFSLPFADDTGIPDTADPQSSLINSVLLVGNLNVGGKYPIATDLKGNVIWFWKALDDGSEGQSLLLRPVAGGTMLFVGSGTNALPERLVEIDVAGNIVRETNMTRVNEQLAAMGEQESIAHFHHDAIRLPNDHTAVLSYVDRVLTDEQGPGDVRVLADAIFVLDENFQLVWVWNAFDHLDRTETAVLGETCVGGQPGCPPDFGPEVGNDWTHANSLDYTPEDGNLVMSVRHLDAVFKIDYADGSGTGDVVWRLGRGGDFQWPTDDIWPWFSHQHYAHFEGEFLVLHDNGNTRVDEDQGLGSGNSRGQVLRLDETNMQVQIVLNTDLGDFSAAGGSTELLLNGNLSSDSGFLDSDDYPFLPPDNNAGLVLETLPDGTSSFAYGTTGFVYRAWRMRSLYDPSS